MTQAPPQEALPDIDLNSLVERARFAEITQHPGAFESVVPYIHRLLLPGRHLRVPLSYTIVVAAISSELPPNEATFKGLRSRLMEYAATDEAYNVVTEAEDAAAEKLREYAYPDAEIPRSVAALALGTTEGAILGWKRGRIAAGSVRYRRRANVKCVTAKAIFNGAIWCRPMLISGKYREVTTQWDMLRSRVLDTQAPQDQ